MVAWCRGDFNCVHMYTCVSDYLAVEYLGDSVRIREY